VPASRGDWTVQLGAFAARGRADGFADRLRDAGFEVRVVQVEGSDLWRVRSGRFPDDGDARDLYDRVRAAGFDAAIVPGASTERGG
jgi:cell division septation protein DedD